MNDTSGNSQAFIVLVVIFVIAWAVIPFAIFRQTALLKLILAELRRRPPAAPEATASTPAAPTPRRRLPGEIGPPPRPAGPEWPE